MILVTTPTGNTGSALLHTLVAAQQPVRVLARIPAKLPAELHTRIDIVQGSMRDPEAFARALDGCESMFFCIPQADDADDVLAHYEDFARIAIEAAKMAGARRVVYLSGAGKESPLAARAGAATALFHAEDMLAASGLALRALRCPVFYESTLWQVAPIRRAQQLFGLLPGAYRHGQVAVRDIALVAAMLLTDTSWNDVAGVGVFGPADVCLDDIAAWIGEALDQPIHYVQLAPEDYHRLLRQFGVSAALATAVTAMFAAIGDGLFDAEPRLAVLPNALAMQQWIEDVFVPTLRNSHQD